MIELFAIAGAQNPGCSKTVTYDNGAKFKCEKLRNGTLNVTPIHQIASKMVEACCNDNLVQENKYYAVFLITQEGVDQKVSDTLSFQDATDLSILLQADQYLEDSELCGDIFGNYVVMPVVENRTSASAKVG